MSIFKYIGKINEVDFTTIEDVLIRFNVISEVSMVGVALTLFFTIYFFHKIRNAFIHKSTDEICLTGQ